MILTDEKLSAFLDGELDAVEMEMVREAIAQDATVSDRLAALADVDRVVKAAAEKATAVALPEEIVALLSDASEAPVSDVNSVNEGVAEPSAKSSSTENITPFVSKAKISRGSSGTQTTWRTPFAIAASVAVLAGLVLLNQQGADTTQPSHWANVSSVLDSNLTGESTTFESGVTVTPQLSFLNTDFNYCRQAKIASQDELNVMIACKDSQGSWMLAASKLDELGGNTGEYQPASSAKLLEDELNKMMASAPLNREQEQNAIEATWLAEKAEGVNDEN
ncbi:anti-sigma factor [Tenacibaculum sp. KUL118]|nr:anti-sigma factor [Tenacibaculum sp. KUL118]